MKVLLEVLVDNDICSSCAKMEFHVPVLSVGPDLAETPASLSLLDCALEEGGKLRVEQ
jgi:hypothetical protein